MSLNSFEIFEKKNQQHSFKTKLASSNINEEFTDVKLPNLNCQTIKK